MSSVKFGQALPRVEDRKLLTGRGRYVDDINLPLQAHGVVVYSNHARARIKSIDTSRSLRSPGMLGVLTGNDIANRGLGGLPPLPAERLVTLPSPFALSLGTGGPVVLAICPASKLSRSMKSSALDDF